MKHWQLAAVAIVLLAVQGCGSSSEFTLTSAAVDPSYACKSAASYAPYSIHATIDSRNGKSSSVAIKSVSAVMTLAAIHGGWLQPVGYKYEAGNVSFAPDHVGAGSSATLDVTIPSACTNHSKAVGPVSYGEYSVALRVTTSTGTFNIESRNRHRIIAA